MFQWNPVTPVIVDSKIAAQAVVDSSAYGLLGGHGVATPMRRLQNKIAVMAAGTARVRWLTFGDSYAQKVYLQTAPVLRTIFGGNKAGSYFPGSYSGVTNNATVGTVTDNTADVALWPSGLTATLGSAGASRTYGTDGVAVTCDTIRVIHANTGGTFKIQVDGVDNITPAVTIDNSVTVTTIAVARAAHTVTVVQLTGAPKIVGVGFEDTTLSGLVTINVSQGALDLSTITTQAWTNFRTFLTAVTPDVLSIEAKESSATFAASLAAMFAATTAAAPSMDVIGIGTPAVGAGDADNVLTNTQLKTACDANGYTFYNTYPILGSYATLVALGWQGDGVHVDVKADQYRGMLMLRDLGLLTLPDLNLIQRLATNADIVVRSKADNITDKSAQSGAVVIDLALSGVQIVRLVGNVTSWSFINGGAAGREVEVWFGQDGVGGRTLAGKDSSIMPSGGALVLTVTAGKFDIVRFRYFSGSYWETSRSMNI